MVRISSAEMQKQFGVYSETAQREPVTITKHGRDSLVLLSVADYERLKSFDTRRHYYAWELPDNIVKAIEEAIPPGESKQFNHEVDD